MTLIYPDASILISAYTEEPFSDIAEAAIVSVPPGQLVSSFWCRTEVASALALKKRRGEIDALVRTLAMRQIEDLLDTSTTSIAIADAHFASAVSFIRQSVAPLRGPDALHLAIAQSARAMVWTLDRGMADAGRSLGLDIRLLA